MKLGVMLPVGQGDGPDGQMPRWADTREIALATEQNGLDSVWLADHFFYRDAAGTTHGMHEAWTLLSAVGAVTERVELGTMVLCSTFRDPGLVAQMAATLDEVSGGRVILGVGAGWHDPEYEAFGLPTDHRASRFAEWVEIVARLIRGETVTSKGTYYAVDEAVLAPMPERRIPILVASRQPRMLDLTAQWADQWNTAWFGAVDDKLRGRLADFDKALARNNRPAAEVAKTVGLTIRDPEQRDAGDPSGFAGSVEELAGVFTAYAELGVEHLIVGLEPVTTRSVERLAAAKRLAFG
ncbi:LLM class flavin-dependent oxidoreductase [Kribbella sp. NPDC051770]|uniref:LLM class flavin-dependent oxidoreductase n=1 Tax=Kribbella sp. NPDC051770 TaxID=3155413 RepID=UPI003423746A